jgi:hypothetical protein
VSTFSPVGSASASVTLAGATTPTLVNITLTANTEASYTLPTNVKGFALKLREMADLKLAFISGTSSTTFFTVPRGTVFWQDGISVTGLSLYFQTPSSGQVLELLAWV